MSRQGNVLAADDAKELSDYFAPTYETARAKFLATAGARGARIERHSHPTLLDTNAEPLSIDTALIGPADARAVLLLTSATHGVEGFCGSGCQVALLCDDAFAAAAQECDVAVLFVHAVNPYGFAYLRRVNEDNVDINRNFHDFAFPLPDNQDYAQLHETLLPAVWPPAEDNPAALNGSIAQMGRRAYQAAISSGQYAFPDGMFFGGHQPSWSNRTIRTILRRYAAQRKRLSWIDLHTGLGPRGHGEKIYAGRDTPEDLHRARAWWGSEVTSFHEGSSASAALNGTMYLAAYEECPGVEYTGIALEFGTASLAEVFAALRADHWRHNHPEISLASAAAIGRTMHDAFFIDTEEWKAAVVTQTRSAALAALHCSAVAKHS